MSDTHSNHSSCLCGGVKITAAKINPNFTVCHCESCRAWGGAPFFAVQCGTDVEIEGSENVCMYRSSSWASRGFCSLCGTHLFYRLEESGEYNVSIGMIPQLANLTMDMQYFSDQRPGYYCFANETREMTKAQVEKFFASQG